MQKDRTAPRSLALHPRDNVAQVSTQADEAPRRVTAGRAPARTTPDRTVLERFPAGGPRGSWPAEKFAADRRSAGQPAEVVMDLHTDTFLVIIRGGAR